MIDLDSLNIFLLTSAPIGPGGSPFTTLPTVHKAGGSELEWRSAKGLKLAALHVSPKTGRVIFEAAQVKTGDLARAADVLVLLANVHEFALEVENLMREAERVALGVASRREDHHVF